MSSRETIVVGAGSAGCVIAARISESSDRSVLLVEAGPDYSRPANLPANLRRGDRNALIGHDWGYLHRANHHRWVPFMYPRGRVMGGSSAINTCIALRGQPYDFDEWADRGLPEWSWDHCLPAFRRLESDFDIDNFWHGQNGPLPIRRHRKDELTSWQAAFIEGCQELGFSEGFDTNDPTTTGYGPHAMNKIAGRRVSAADAYLTAAVRTRENLTIRPNTLVRRVLFKNRVATGIEVETHGRIETLFAKRIVLAAGAIHTPGILLRSGVGPRSELDRLGVETVADVPAVGARLLDHPGTALFMRPKTGVVDLQDPLIQNVLRHTAKGSSQQNDMLLQPGSVVVFPWFDLPLCSIMGHVGKPAGHGTIRWPSADPQAKPKIDSRLLEHPKDLRRAVDNMQLAYRLCQTQPMRSLARHFWPSPKVLKDRARTEAWIFKACDSGYHPAGTVPMGPQDAPDAATDGRGRVRGVDGLIVADASLMPTMTSSNTNLPTLMIGERFGQWLRADP